MKILDFIKNLIYKNKTLKLNENNKVKDKKVWEIDEKVLFEIVKEILTNEGFFNEYINSDKMYKEIEKEEIEDYFASNISYIEKKIKFKDEDYIRKYFLENKTNVRKTSEKIDTNIKLNEKFENLVMQDISPKLTGIDLAFAIYNQLNKRVKYNPAFFALDQDLDLEFLKSIYEENIEKINEKDNKVVCSTWAKLYAYFLEKNGIETYISKRGRHKYVQAFVGDKRIQADATNPSNSLEDPSKLTDLVRSKLGLRPAGFNVYDMNNNRQEIGKEIDIVKNDYTKIDYSTVENTEEYKELMNLLDDGKDYTKTILELDDEEDSMKNIMTKITFINETMKQTKLDNIENLGYLIHVFGNVLTKEERKRVILNYSLCENLYTNCKLVPIISIYKGEINDDNEKKNLEDYLFLTLNEENYEFEKITREQIINNVIDGKFERIIKDKEYRYIAGIPDIRLSIDKLKQKYRKNEEIDTLNKQFNKNNKTKDEGR